MYMKTQVYLLLPIPNLRGYHPHCLLHVHVCHQAAQTALESYMYMHTLLTHQHLASSIQSVRTPVRVCWQVRARGTSHGKGGTDWTTRGGPGCCDWCPTSPGACGGVSSEAGSTGRSACSTVSAEEKRRGLGGGRRVQTVANQSTIFHALIVTHPALIIIFHRGTLIRTCSTAYT